MKTRRAFFWAVAGQILTFVLNFGSSIIVARLLSPVEMGTFIIGMATIGLISSFTSLGVGAYVIREPVLAPETLNTAFTLNAILSLTLATIVLVFSRMSGWALGSREAGNVLLLLTLTPVLGIFSFRPSTLLQRDLEFKTIALITTTANVIGVCVTVVTAWNGASYMAPAWGSLATAVANLLGYVTLGARYLGGGVGMTGWRAMLAFGLRIVTISGAASMSARLQDISLGRLLGLRALGLYSRASSLSGQIFDNVYGTATRVVFAHLSEEHRRTGSLDHSFLRSFRMITGVMWPFLLGLAILSPIVIYNLYGAKWMAAAAPLSILLVAQVVALCFGMNWELFVIKDETALQTRIELYRNVAGLTVFAIGCLFSLTGAAIGRLCDNLVGLAMYRKHVTRLSGLTASQLNGAYREGALLSVSAVTPVALLMAHQRWSEHTPLPLAFAATGLGVAFWVACVLYLRHPLAEEAAVIWGAIGRGLGGLGRKSRSAG